MITEYKIITTPVPEKLEILVNESIQEGRQPYQGITIDKFNNFYQVMIKEDKVI